MARTPASTPDAAQHRQYILRPRQAFAPDTANLTHIGWTVEFHTFARPDAGRLDWMLISRRGHETNTPRR
jgi:hypothetical protein